MTNGLDGLKKGINIIKNSFLFFYNRLITKA